MSDFDSVDLEFLRKRAALKWGRWQEDVDLCLTLFEEALREVTRT